jgi:hypothetical protein
MFSVVSNVRCRLAHGSINVLHDSQRFSEGSMLYVLLAIFYRTEAHALNVRRIFHFTCSECDETQAYVTLKTLCEIVRSALYFHGCEIR